jgi:hypothetical protein
MYSSSFMSNLIMLPDHPDFQDWLGLPPPSWTGQGALIADAQTGIPREASEQEFWEYCLGGEYDLRQEVIADDDLY